MVHEQGSSRLVCWGSWFGPQTGIHTGIQQAVGQGTPPILRPGASGLGTRSPTSTSLLIPPHPRSNLGK